MAKGNEIIVKGNGPERGVRHEGTISGAAYPGIIMQIKNTALVKKKPVWEPYNPTNGDGGFPRFGWAVLLPDFGRGRGSDPTDSNNQYADGAWAFLYTPGRGEELNILFKNITGTGTGDECNVGDSITCDAGTGKGILTVGSSESPASPIWYPFVALEAITDVTADQLLHVFVN